MSDEETLNNAPVNETTDEVEESTSAEEVAETDTEDSAEEEAEA